MRKETDVRVTFDRKTGKYRVEAKGPLDRQGVLRLIASASDALVEGGRGASLSEAARVMVTPGRRPRGRPPRPA
jgi:hypothetical protein